MASAGPASEALENELSVPGKESWEANVEIAELYKGTGGDTSPLVSVATLPEGESFDSPAVQVDGVPKIGPNRRVLAGSSWSRQTTVFRHFWLQESGPFTLDLSEPSVNGQGVGRQLDTPQENPSRRPRSPGLAESPFLTARAGRRFDKAAGARSPSHRSRSRKGSGRQTNHLLRYWPQVVYRNAVAYEGDPADPRQRLGRALAVIQLTEKPHRLKTRQ